MGTLFATFLSEEKVVDFIASVLGWYKQKAEGPGRIGIGDTIIKEGPRALLGHLHTHFPENTVTETIAPQVFATQVGILRP